MRRISDEAAKASDARVEPRQGVVEGSDRGRISSWHAASESRWSSSSMSIFAASAARLREAPSLGSTASHVPAEQSKTPTMTYGQSK